MSYYTSSTGRTAKFTCNGPAGKQITITGSLRGLEPIHLKSSPSDYLSYEVITVAGKSEVIEHRKTEPVFYVSDDADIRNQLGVAAN